ncbi:hypothetical protein AB0G79_14205 [Streptomyces sp. NPDC020807]|uniref:hypothetical protein n=1 Tax=Streptomyces sp. NPDC020807 TaxID=3155119 RepID=UPI0033CD0994
MTARATLRSLAGAPPEIAATAGQLAHLLAESRPLVAPLPGPRPGQLTPAAVLRREIRDYPRLLDESIGAVGPDPVLGYVTAECALAALRHQDLQGALAMLFLSTLCSREWEEGAVEALHHVLVSTDADGAVGLLELGARRAGIDAAEEAMARQGLGLRFVTTAVQIRGVAAPGASGGGPGRGRCGALGAAAGWRPG